MNYTWDKCEEREREKWEAMQRNHDVNEDGLYLVLLVLTRTHSVRTPGAKVKLLYNKVRIE